MLFSIFAGKNSEEKQADLYALRPLYEFSCLKEDDFEKPGAFVQAYGIPIRMMSAAKELFKKYNE